MIPKVKPFDAYKSHLDLRTTLPGLTMTVRYWKVEHLSKHFIKERTDFGLRNSQDRRMIKRSSTSPSPNFSMSDDPGTLWIGEVIRNGESNYTE